jgi:hypothetical protein
MKLDRTELNRVKGVVSRPARGAGTRGVAVMVPSVHQVTFASVTQTQTKFVT